MYIPCVALDCNGQLLYRGSLGMGVAPKGDFQYWNNAIQSPILAARHISSWPEEPSNIVNKISSICGSSSCFVCFSACPQFEVKKRRMYVPFFDMWQADDCLLAG